MIYNNPGRYKIFFSVVTFLYLLFFLEACTKPKFQGNKPYFYKNNIEVKGGSFTKDELLALTQRLYGQITDSARSVKKKQKGLFGKREINYPAYDSSATRESADNMKTSMRFIGYFSSTIKVDTSTRANDRKRVFVNYNVNAGNPTRIDTIGYRLKKPELLQLALDRQKDYGPFPLVRGNPVAKQDVLAEKGRLINLFRNKGYYKFSPDILRIRADTSISALTDIDDPFSVFNALSARRDSPTIKLSVDLVVPKSDSNRLIKYYINNVYIFPDYKPGDSLNFPGFNRDTLISRRYPGRHTYVFYHDYLFKNNFLARNLFLHTGDVYSQDDFYKTVNSFSKKGTWASVNMNTIDSKDSLGKLDLIIQMIPSLKNTIEGNVEMSLSNSNINSLTTSNLIGLSTNLGWTTRNVAREGIQMTLKGGAGIEFSTGTRNIINSNDVNLAHSTIFPKIIWPYNLFVGTRKKNTPNRAKRKDNSVSRQSFTNTSLSYVNRINLFDLQTVNVNAGFNISGNRKANNSSYQITVKLPNIEFTKLYHQTDTFNKILDQNQFLKYSFRTALVLTNSVSYRDDKLSSKHPNLLRTVKANLDLPFPFPFPVSLRSIFKSDNSIFQKYLREFVKLDGELIYTFNKQSRKQLQTVYRAFLGVGIPTSKSDTTLPFFKQYFGGGSSSMRGWPVRGIGLGSQPLKPFSNISGFNDRTGDIQLELNAERRQNLFTISPNSIIVKYSLFADIGNIWNVKNSKGYGIDSTQFKFKNIFRQLGADAGAGIAIDFTYFLVRFDVALRFKRPDVSENFGFQFPNANLKNLFTKEGRQWRYENLNLSIGIGYPFQ